MLSAVSMLVYVGQFDAFASKRIRDDLDDEPGKHLVIATTDDPIPGPINDITQQNLLIIFEEISKVINPRHLTSVCKAWENDFGLKNELYYTDMGQFMQRCMNIFWTNQSYTKQFYNGVLRYTPANDGQVVTLPFSGLQDGTFDLSACNYTGKYLVITTSMDRFFTIEAENKDKTVILITLRHMVEKEIKSPDHPFLSLMAGWDPDKAPVGMFWRWGNDKNLTWYYYLTSAPMPEISCLSLIENWKKSARADGGRDGRWSGVSPAGGFHVNFLSRNEDY